jgi:hypothetical protein
MKRRNSLWQRVYRSYRLSNLGVVEWIVVIAVGAWVIQWVIRYLSHSWF